MNIEIELWYIN